MSKLGLDHRHRNKNGEISGKHGNALVRTLRKIYGHWQKSGSSPAVQRYETSQ
jgi:hypothetical protein